MGLTMAANTGSGLHNPPVHKNFRFPALLALSAAAFIFLPGRTFEPLSVETPGGTIAVYNGAPVLGMGRELWALEADQCWRRIAEVGGGSTKIQALLPVEDGLLIGTNRNGLWVFDGTVAVHDKRDYLYITQDNPYVYAITRISSTQILIGTAGNNPKPDAIRSGIWTWDFAYDPPVWRDNLDLGFPPGVTVKSIVVDPHSAPETVYAGTSLNGVYALGADGLWKRTAEEIRGDAHNVFFGADIQQIAVSPSANYHVVYAAAASGYEFSSGFFRIYPERENAAWEQLDVAPLSSSDDVWAAAPDPDPGRPLGVWIGTDKGLFYSTSAGDGWILVGISPQQPRVQAVLPFQDALIVLTADGIVQAKLSEARKTSPQWIAYQAVSEERLCPYGAGATEQAVSPTAGPTQTVTPALTPSPTASAAATGIAGSAVPAFPQATATPAGGGGRDTWASFLDQLMKNLADILCIVIPLVLAILLVGIWRRRTGGSFFKFVTEVIVDALKEGPGKAIARQIQKGAGGKSDSTAAGEGGHPQEEEKLPVKVERGRKISILFLAADPTDASRLRLGEEIREIQEKLQLSRLRDKFEFNQRMSVRPQDISQALLDLKPDIVHFSGHGSESGELCFEGPGGESRPVPAEALADLFGQFSSQVDCVVLNACFSGKQAAAIARHIDYVIGMKKEIDDRAAIAFAVGFYQGLGGGRTIAEAYKLGCIQIQLQNVPGHLTPILLKKNRT
jgi:hypothetical protein